MKNGINGNVYRKPAPRGLPNLGASETAIVLVCDVVGGFARVNANRTFVVCDTREDEDALQALVLALGELAGVYRRIGEYYLRRAPKPQAARRKGPSVPRAARVGAGRA